MLEGEVKALAERITRTHERSHELSNKLQVLELKAATSGLAIDRLQGLPEDVHGLKLELASWKGKVVGALGVVSLLIPILTVGLQWLLKR